MLTAFPADESAPSPNSGFRNVTALSWKGTFIVPLKRSCCVYCNHMVSTHACCFRKTLKKRWETILILCVRWHYQIYLWQDTDAVKQTQIIQLKKRIRTFFFQFLTQNKNIFRVHTQLGWHIYIILVIMIWPHLPSRMHSGRKWGNHCKANFKLSLLYKQTWPDVKPPQPCHTRVASTHEHNVFWYRKMWKKNGKQLLLMSVACRSQCC